MTNKKVTVVIDESKRKVLLGAATGAALVGAWQKPIVDAVILPAHATTSIGSDDDSTDGEEDPVEDPVEEQLTYFLEGDIQSPVFETVESGASLLDLLIKPAYAGNGNTSDLLEIPAKASPLGDGEWELEIRDIFNALARKGIVSESAAGVLIPVDGDNPNTILCDDFASAGDLNATIISVTDEEMIISIDGEKTSFELTLPVGDGELADLISLDCLIPFDGESSNGEEAD